MHYFLVHIIAHIIAIDITYIFIIYTTAPIVVKNSEMFQSFTSHVQQF